MRRTGNLIKSVNAYIRSQRKEWLIASGFMLLVFVALVDYMAGAELKISIFYLLPISLMIWFVNRRIGVIFAILSSTLEVMTDLMVGHPYSHPIIVFWNGAVQAVFFVIIVLTLSALRRGYEKTLKINARVKVALFLGILVIAELMFFLYLGSSFFKLFSHLGQLHTFTFQMLIYVELLDLLIIRERKHFWNSRPSKFLLLAIAGDLVLVFLISVLGLPGIVSITPTAALSVVILSVMVVCLINDPIKVVLIKRFWQQF